MTKPEILLVGTMGAQLKTDLDAHFEVHMLEQQPDPQAFLANAANNIRAIATGGADKLPNQVMDALPHLGIISCYGVGYDGIDAKRAASRGVLVSHTPDVLNDEVANTTIALLLATTRRVVAFDRYVREGRWKSEGPAPLTHGIAGKKVGIVGMGRIGQAIAEKLGVFRCEIAYHTRNPRPELAMRHFPVLLSLAEWADVMIVITPGGAATHHLVDRPVLDALGSQGTLINVARGTVIDEEALVSALREGRLGAAGLDVFENEPEVPQALFAMDNVVLLPHVGSATVETRAAMRKLVADNLVNWYASGKALTPVPKCRHLQED
ncbi:MAG: 2-hydroxyacid dehydrogenase [Nitratireductor sp.]|nr:2-hydroxyacid dehydrogenase [Nitratireductor sp.]